MYHHNTLPAHGTALDPRDAKLLGEDGVASVAEILALREGHAATPLHALPGLAQALGIGSLHVKDEGHRLGLGRFACVHFIRERFDLALNQLEIGLDVARRDRRAHFDRACIRRKLGSFSAFAGPERPSIAKGI